MQCRERYAAATAVQLSASVLSALWCYPSTAKVWQTLNIGKSSIIPNNLIISGAVNGQIPGHCLGVVGQTLPVLRYMQQGVCVQCRERYAAATAVEDKALWETQLVALQDTQQLVKAEVASVAASLTLRKRAAAYAHHRKSGQAQISQLQVRCCVLQQRHGISVGLARLVSSSRFDRLGQLGCFERLGQLGKLEHIRALHRALAALATRLHVFSTLCCTIGCTL